MDKEIAKLLALKHQEYKSQFDRGVDRPLLASMMVRMQEMMQRHLTDFGVAYTPSELPGDKAYWTFVEKSDELFGKSTITYEEDK